MSTFLFSREQGQGKALLFLHGFCETHEIWMNFIDPLTKHFRVIVLDLPGFGRSDSLPSPFTIDQVGNAVAGWMTEKNLNKAITMGHSLGGYVALSIAEHHPEKVAGLGLIHSTIFADSEEKRNNRNKVIDFVRKNGVKPFIDTFVPGLFFDKMHPAAADVRRIALGSRPETLIAYAEAMRDRPDRTLIWQNAAIHKLLIAGVEDTLVPLEASREMSKLALHADYFELEKTAHMGFFEAKSECQEIIKRFTYGVEFNK